MDDSSTLRVLLEAHGMILSAGATARVLGFPSTDALRLARSRGRLPIAMFKVSGRRGWFASTRDVARWLDQTTNGTKTSKITSELARGASADEAMALTSEGQRGVERLGRMREDLTSEH